MKPSTRLPTKILIYVACMMAAISCLNSAIAQTRWVRIDSNRPESNVYADSTWLGLANKDIYQLPDGTRQVSLIPEIADLWSVPSVTYDVSTLKADTSYLELNFPYYYSLESIPSGATVFLGDISSGDVLGVTPMLYTSESAILDAFVFELAGYQIEHVIPESNLWNRHLVSLQSESDLYLGMPEASTDAPTPRRKWIDYLAVSAVFVGGALAVHYKSEANSLYEEYTQTGDPDLLTQVQALDTRSAVALVTMQAGFTVVVFRVAF